MIKITVNSNLITISGHANYSNTEDIVCASVSSIMYTTVNAILRFDSSAITYLDDRDKVEIKINNHNETTTTLIENMLSLFYELESNYKKNIQIRKEDK